MTEENEIENVVIENQPNPLTGSRNSSWNGSRKKGDEDLAIILAMCRLLYEWKRKI